MIINIETHHGSDVHEYWCSQLLVHGIGHGSSGMVDAELDGVAEKDRELAKRRLKRIMGIRGVQEAFLDGYCLTIHKSPAIEWWSIDNAVIHYLPRLKMIGKV